MDRSGETLARHTQEFPQHFPAPGQVEHDPEAIWSSVLASVSEALCAAQVRGDRIAAIGITNQRETTLVWDRATGRPIYPAIVWQDRRTVGACVALRNAGLSSRVKETTGLLLDPYFSATKIAWILDNVAGARLRAVRGELAFGTVDTFLTWRMSGDVHRGRPVHVTDVTNASRTLLMNLRSLQWDQGMLEIFGVPGAMLPRIVGSAERVATTRGLGVLPDGIPIAGIAGDQQAALFGQACSQVGDAKCTYGTGAFVLVNTGAEPRWSRHGLLTTVAWKIRDDVAFALEGSVFVAGAAIQWLRDGLGILSQLSDVEPLARSVASSGGVTFVPALSGLGAPYWDPDARGLLCGITRGTTSAHLARATLEAISLQVTELLQAITEDLGASIAKLRVDGGASRNDLLMALQADLANVDIERAADVESTARGAAMLAAIGAGICASVGETSRMSKTSGVFRSEMTEEERSTRLARWRDAVARTRATGRFASA
jgi:glycerol kinase